MTFARLALLTLVVLWGVEALVWGRPLSAAVGLLVSVLRIALFAALAIFALRRGRRWTAPLRALGIAVLAILGPFMVGVLSGDYLARKLSPGFVLAFTIGWIGIAVLTVLVATLGVLLWQRHRRIAPAAAD